VTKAHKNSGLAGVLILDTTIIQQMPIFKIAAISKYSVAGKYGKPL